MRRPAKGQASAEGERDYLAPAQLEVDPGSFSSVVREVFLLEHGCAQNQEIAAVIGTDKSRVTQMFSDPSKLKAETVQRLLSRLARPRNRLRVVEAWNRECFGGMVGSEDGEVTGKSVSARTLRRVDRQIRESRLEQAARTAVEAATKAGDPVLREQFLDRAYFAYQRLDLPGRAMAVARQVEEGARERGDYHRLAAAYAMRARILLGLSDASPEEIEGALVAAESALPSGSSPSSDKPFVVGERRGLATMRLNALLTLAERGRKTLSAEDLDRLLVAFKAEAKAGTPYARRFRALQSAARAALLLGRSFEAQELLDRSFDSGEVKNLQAVETSGLLLGRILAATEGPAAAAAHLRAVSENCAKASDAYHRRLAEADLARAEAALFGPSDPRQRGG